MVWITGEKPAKAKPKVSTTHKNAVALKKAGLIDYDLRKALTKSQARQVQRLTKKMGVVLADPKNFFHVKADTKAIAALAKHNPDIVVHGKDLFVEKRGYEKAKLIDDRLILTRKDEWDRNAKGRAIRRQHKRLDYQLMKNTDILKELERLKDVELPPRTFIMVRIGNNRAFPGGIQKILDYNSLLNYISNWEPDSLKDYRAGKYHGKYSYDELIEQKADLIQSMSIVSYRM